MITEEREENVIAQVFTENDLEALANPPEEEETTLPILAEPFSMTSFRGNQNLKPRNSSEAVPIESFQRYTAEIAKCIRDPIYFARNYFYIVSPGKGKHIIDTYQKQDDLIRTIFKENRVVVLASRQSGKCVSPETSIRLRWPGQDKMMLPISRVHSLIKSRGKVEPTADTKFTETVSTTEPFEVKSPRGWERVVRSHRTVPFVEHFLQTANGSSLYCADHHLVVTPFGLVRAEDISDGSFVMTQGGVDRVVVSERTKNTTEMYDLELEPGSEHVYYTDGILSHNTTSYSIFCCHTLCFNEDKSILIMANKAATAVEIVGRVRLAFELLPKWLKPGVNTWNRGSAELSNGCKIEGVATSPDTARSKSCLGGESLVRIQIGPDAPQTVPISEVGKMFPSDSVKIETLNGFVPVKGWRELSGSFEGREIRTASGTSLRFTDDHILKDGNDDDVLGKDVSEGTFLMTIDGPEAVVSSKEIVMEKVYDMVDVEGHLFLANGINVHNCNVLIVDECMSGKTRLRLRNSVTGEEKDISAEEIFVDPTLGLIPVDESTLPPEFLERAPEAERFVVPNWEVSTPDGWSKFDYVKRTSPRTGMVRVTLENGMHIECTENEKLYSTKDERSTGDVEGREGEQLKTEPTKVSSLRIGDLVETETGMSPIVSIEPMEKTEWVYNLVNVEKEHRHYANGILRTQCAFIPPNIMYEVWQSVYPIISSAMNTKCIMVSTPNGIGNLFYETWSAANFGINNDVGWKPFRIDWWDVPLRDAKWKEQQISAFNGNMVRFNQEFGCVEGSTLVPIVNPYTGEQFFTTIAEVYKAYDRRKKCFTMDLRPSQKP